MTGLEIALLCIGVVFIAGSFFITEKLSASDMKDIEKLSEKEMHILVEKQMREASQTMEETIQEHLNQAIETLEEKSDKETNEKIMAIGEYSDTVLDAMNKSHNEVMFMYSMLNEKQEKLTELTREIQELESSLVLKKEEAVQIHTTVEKPEIPEITKGTTISLKEAMARHIEETAADDAEPKNKNQEILKLSQEGCTQVEIAKALGLGLGEVKLVLGLYEEQS